MCVSISHRRLCASWSTYIWYLLLSFNFLVSVLLWIRLSSFPIQIKPPYFKKFNILIGFHSPPKLTELVRNIFCKRKVHVHRLLEESDLWDACAFGALACGPPLGAWRRRGERMHSA